MNTLTDYLMTKTKKELVTIAKYHHMAGYSSLNKEQLGNKLGTYLLLPSVMHSFFVYLGDDELDTFFHTSSHLILYQRFCQGGYCFLQKDGTYVIPDEVKQHPIFTASFRKEQHKKSFLLDCIHTAGYLYGCCPVSILLKMYQSSLGISIDLTTFLKELQDIPHYYHSFVIKNHLLIPLALYENDLYKKIQKCQGVLPFFLPEKTVILHLARYGCFPEDVHTKKLTTTLCRSFSISPMEAKILSGKIQSIFRQGGSISDAISFLQTKTDSFPKEQALLVSLNDVFSHTRLLLCRGYTASQAVELRKKSTKIYPNSPCPCGSGKKYKNCCGRH